MSGPDDEGADEARESSGGGAEREASSRGDDDAERGSEAESTGDGRDGAEARARAEREATPSEPPGERESLSSLPPPSPRRRFFGRLVRGTVFVGLLAAGGGWIFGRERIDRWRLARALRGALPHLRFADGAVESFVVALETHEGDLAHRALDEPRLLELFAGRLLLSTDFFQEGADESRVLRYAGYASPYAGACSNPFAQPAEGAGRGASLPQSAEALFDARCAACHDAGGAPSLEGVGGRQERDALGTVLREGRGTMPSARALGLDDAEVDTLVDWLE